MSVNIEEWIPKTKLGQMVKDGKITRLEEIFENNLKIKEPEIVAALLPNLKQEVITVNYVQRQTDAGEIGSFRVLVVVGDENGHLGMGIGKSRQMRIAINKAFNSALLNTVPVLRGCGSWECSCTRPHSVPFKVTGKSGSVEITIYPAPRGLGLVAGETVKLVMSMAGIQDAWTRSRGETRTTLNLALATYNALKSTYKFNIMRG